MRRFGTRLHLAASGSPQEVAGRLKALVDPPRRAWSLSGYAGSGPFIGNISERGFEIWSRRSYHNAFAPVIRGTIQSGGANTVWIDASIGLSSGTAAMIGLIGAFDVVWLGGVIATEAQRAIVSGNASSLASLWVPCALLLAFVGVAVLLGTFGWLIEQESAADLRGVLEQVGHARGSCAIQ